MFVIRMDVKTFFEFYLSIMQNALIFGKISKMSSPKKFFFQKYRKLVVSGKKFFRRWIHVLKTFLHWKNKKNWRFFIFSRNKLSVLIQIYFCSKCGFLFCEIQQEHSGVTEGLALPSWRYLLSTILSLVLY